MKPGDITIRRLKKMVSILRGIKAPEEILSDQRPRFCMAQFYHDCGAPACQLGYYLASTDRWVKVELGVRRKEDGLLYSYLGAAKEEFPGLTDLEIHQLFVNFAFFNVREEVIHADEMFINDKLAEG